MMFAVSHAVLSADHGSNFSLFLEQEIFGLLLSNRLSCILKKKISYFISLLSFYWLLGSVERGPAGHWRIVANSWPRCGDSLSCSAPPFPLPCILAYFNLLYLSVMYIS